MDEENNPTAQENNQPTNNLGNPNGAPINPGSIQEQNTERKRPNFSSNSRYS